MDKMDKTESPDVAASEKRSRGAKAAQKYRAKVRMNINLLRNENDRLRRENDRLEQENAACRRELARLRAALVALTHTEMQDQVSHSERALRSAFHSLVETHGCTTPSEPGASLLPAGSDSLDDSLLLATIDEVPFNSSAVVPSPWVDAWVPT